MMIKPYVQTFAVYDINTYIWMILHNADIIFHISEQKSTIH